MCAALAFFLTPLVLDARSGHGDGMGDIFTMLFLLPSLPLLNLGGLFAVGGVWGGARRVAVGGAVAVALGAVLTLPVLELRGTGPRLVVLCGVAAAVAAGVAAAGVSRPGGASGSPSPDRGP